MVPKRSRDFQREEMEETSSSEDSEEDDEGKAILKTEKAKELNP